MSLAILCPGQGSQEPATFMALARQPRNRDVAAAFEHETGIAIADLANVPAHDLQANALAQPLVCATALAAFAAIRDRIPEPAVFAGYSVGELAAYGCAGWLTPAETIRLARARAAAMDEASPDPAGMVAVRGLSRDALDALLAGTRAHVAIVNGADRFIVAGLARAVERVASEAGGRGANVTRLGVRVASHTPLLRPAVERFRAALERSALRPAAPVLAGIDGTPVLDRTRAIETLAEQIAAPVLWSACIEGLLEAGAGTALELPSGADLAKLVREAAPSIGVRAYAEFRTTEGLVSWLSRRSS